MKLELDVPMVRLLHGLLVRPDMLPIDQLGLPSDPRTGVPSFAHYKASDSTGQKQVAALQKWLQKRVMVELPDGNFKFENCIVGLKQTYVDRLKEIAKHYNQLGGLVVLAEPYSRLVAALNGEKYIEDDPWEDIEEDSEGKEEEKETVGKDAENEVETEKEAQAAAQ